MFLMTPSIEQALVESFEAYEGVKIIEMVTYLDPRVAGLRISLRVRFWWEEDISLTTGSMAGEHSDLVLARIIDLIRAAVQQRRAELVSVL